MLIKPGVSLRNLCRECRRTLSAIENAYPDFVITSTDEGTHSPSSLHYADRAFDIRLQYPARWKDISPDHLRRMLGPKFDCLREHTHFHIEYEG